MTLQQIQCFITTARTGSINTAADELFYTQSTVSYQIRSMEKELGFSLFFRSASGVELTEAGRMLLADMEQGYAQILKGITTAKSIAMGTQRLTVALCQLMSLAKVGALMDSAQKEYPYCKFNLIPFDELNPLKPVLSGEADVAFVSRPALNRVKGWEYWELYHSPWYLLVSRKEPLAGRNTISIKEAADLTYPLLDAELMESFPEYGEYLSRLREINPQLKLYYNRFSGMHEINAMVAAGKTVGIRTPILMDTVIDSKEIAAIRIEDYPEFSIGVAYASHSENPIRDAFVEMVRSYPDWY